MNKIYFLIILTMTVNCKAQTNTVDIINQCNTIYNDSDGSTYFKDNNNLYQPYVGT